MADDKPLLYERKLLYIAPLVIAMIVAVIIGVVLFRVPKPAPMPRPAVHVQAAVPPVQPVLPVAPPPALTRGDLVAVARAAADGFAATGKLPADAAGLVGRRFALRLAFGCNGAEAPYGPSQMSATFNAGNQSVALAATPGLWTSLPMMQALPDAADVESVEGFWIPRPWTGTGGCPPRMNYPVPPVSTPPTAQTLGLAQLFESGGSRAGRQPGQSYAFTRKLAAGDTALLGHSYRLVLEGSITGYGDGRALHCAAESPNHHPVCIFAVRFDHVSFEDGDTGETLATWSQ